MFPRDAAENPKPCSDRIIRVTAPGYVPMFRLGFTDIKSGSTGGGLSLAKRQWRVTPDNKWLAKPCVQTAL